MSFSLVFYIHRWLINSVVLDFAKVSFFDYTIKDTLCKNAQSDKLLHASFSFLTILIALRCVAFGLI